MQILYLNFILSLRERRVLFTLISRNECSDWIMKVNDIQIEEKLASIQFMCDLEKCKGACCTFPGGTGAPVTEIEAALLHEVYPVVKKYLPENHVAVAELHGLVEGRFGARSIRCFDQRACIFACFDGDVAYCAIQRAYGNGEIDWVKPLSCHLFPLRVRESAGGAHLVFEEFSECHSALERGARERVPVVSFLESSLKRAYGERWYRDLLDKLPTPAGMFSDQDQKE